jgi:ABC-2 type transport system ATP-binding protein
MNAIVIQNFYKQYGDFRAVSDVTLSIKRGELFGLIGPDGAGKTTLMRSICTLLVPSSGKIYVNGMEVRENVHKIRSILGYMPQRFSLYQDLTVEQNLQFFADIFKVPFQEREKRLGQLYKFSRLEPFKKRYAGALSGGMKQKLALSCALIHTPDILILDEPTFGVDPVSRVEFWDILRLIQKEGTTIFVSTAYMDEADQCERVALMHKGTIFAVEQPAKLKKQFIHPLYKVDAQKLRVVQDFFQSNAQVRNTQLFGDSLHVSFEENPSQEDWVSWQKKTEGLIVGWETITPSIEDVFLDLAETSK